MRFTLNKQQLARFLSWYHIGIMAIMVLPAIAFMIFIVVIEDEAPTPLLVIMGLALALGLAYIPFALWYATTFTKSLDYRIEDHILYVEEGVFNLNRKAIPLDRVTDIRLMQDLMMRWFGIWRIHVQTAGDGMTSAEGVLWAIEAPKVVRDDLLTARKAAVQAQRIETAA